MRFRGLFINDNSFNAHSKLVIERNRDIMCEGYF
jgi:hypothetical protein